jgi:hypothetical protein
MISLEVDRIQLAAAKVLEIQERIPFPANPSIPHPIGLVKEAEQQVAATHCVVCRRSGVSLEQHHIAGRANLPDTISLCKTCHDEVTNIYQAKWIPWADAERDPLECYFLGWSDIFHLIWQRTRHLYFYELSKSFALNARYQHEA